MPNGSLNSRGRHAFSLNSTGGYAYTLNSSGQHALEGDAFVVTLGLADATAEGFALAVTHPELVTIGLADATAEGFSITVTEGSSSNDLLDILINSWEMEESSGDRADSHGSSDLVEILSGSISSGTGIIGTAVDFIANTGILRETSVADMQIGTGSKAFEVWINLDTIPTGFRGIMMFGATNSSDEGMNIALYGTNSTIRVNLSNGTTRVVSDGTSSVLTAGTWHQILVVIRDGSRMKTYVDNVEVGDKSISGFNGDDIQSSNNFDVNGFFVSGGIVGLMDSVRVYSDVPTAAMRTFLWNSGAGRSYADLSTFS